MPLTHRPLCGTRVTSAIFRRPLHIHSVRPSTIPPAFKYHGQVLSTLKSQTAAPGALYPRSAVLKPSNPLSVNMPVTQTRTHAGHSHDGPLDNTYLTSANKKDAGVRITRIGLFVNLAMAIGKGIGGYIFHSQALIADAFHSLTDLVSDFMTLATISWSLKPPSERFPNGYGKVESLGALGVSGLLLFGGIGMGMNAIDAIYVQFFAEMMGNGQSHGLFPFLGHKHSDGASLPSLNAAWLAAGSIVVKEWLYRASKCSPSRCRTWR